MIFENQDVSGRDFTQAYVEEGINAENMDYVTHEIVDGSLTITDLVHSFVGANFTGATMVEVKLGGTDFPPCHAAERQPASSEFDGLHLRGQRFKWR